MKYACRVLRKVGKFIRRPFIIVPLIILALGCAWYFYTYEARHLSTTRHNLLPAGAFDDFDEKGVPRGWSVTQSGTLSVKTEQKPGHVSGSSFAATVEGYQKGDATISSSEVAVEPGKTYLYKGYYLATTDFDLLVRYLYQDGSEELRFMGTHYHYGDPWSTASAAFKAGQGVRAVQVVYRLANNGMLQLDGSYLTEKHDVVLAPELSHGQNVIPNASFADRDGQTPTNWHSAQGGDNQAAFAYVTDGGESFLRTTVQDYKDGEAKWQHPLVPAKPGERYALAVTYRSDAPVELVIEYVAGSEYKFLVLDDVIPASSWTTYSTDFVVPAGATEMLAAVVLHANGTLETRDYQLSRIAEASQFDRPLVTVTFDDGWLSSYLAGAKLMDHYGFKGTYYLNPEAIGRQSFVTVDQAKDLQGRGHQLASHGYMHIDMTSIDTGELNRQLKRSKDYLQKQFGITDMDFATPYGRDDAEVQFYSRKYYRSHRDTEGGLNLRSNFDPYRLKTLFVRNDTSLDFVRGELEEAKANNGWLILTYHRIEEGLPQDETAITPETLAQHLELIKQSGIQVSTIEQAMQQLQPQH